MRFLCLFAAIKGVPPITNHQSPFTFFRRYLRPFQPPENFGAAVRVLLGFSI